MKRVNSLLLAAAVTGAVLAGSASVAHAQYQPGYYPPPPPPRPYYRSGIVLGGSLGVGSISGSDCGDYCGAAFAIEGHIGGMLNPRMALMGDFWLNLHAVDGTDITTSNSFSTAALQYWATDIVWLKGGLGIAHREASDSFGTFVDSSATALGLMGAVGAELLHAPTFALDLQLRVGHAFYSEVPLNNVGLMVGFTWY